MNLFTLLAVAIALGTDAFSLALGMGLTGIRRREMLIFPCVVAILHVFMPLTGMYAGSFMGELLGQLAAVVGGGILLIIGGRVLYKSLFKKETETYTFSTARKALFNRRAVNTRSLPGLILLAFSVSLDALSVGFSLGALGAGILRAVLTMGVVAGGMTATGLLFGRSLGQWIGKWAETAGGLILVLIGFKIML